MPLVSNPQEDSGADPRGLHAFELASVAHLPFRQFTNRLMRLRDTVLQLIAAEIARLPNALDRLREEEMSARRFATRHWWDQFLQHHEKGYAARLRIVTKAAVDQTAQTL